jgi:hypothetical protein
MIIYARASLLRKPVFQIATTIERSDQKISVYKRTLSDDAIGHIGEIVKNYEILSNLELPFQIIQPWVMSESQIRFDYIDGTRLDSMLRESVSRNDQASIISILDGVIDTIKRLPSTKLNPVTQPKFVEVFGNNFNDMQDCLNVGYIDFNLDNFIMRGPDKYLIDYEWLFDFNIPVNFVITRMLHYSLSSISYHYRTVASISRPIVSVGDHIFIDEALYKRYAKWLDSLAEMHRAERFLHNHVNIQQIETNITINTGVLRHTQPLFPSLINQAAHSEGRLLQLAQENQLLATSLNEAETNLRQLQAKYNNLISSRLVQAAARLRTKRKKSDTDTA